MSWRVASAKQLDVSLPRLQSAALSFSGAENWKINEQIGMLSICERLARSSDGLIPTKWERERRDINCSSDQRNEAFSTRFMK